MLVVVPMTKTRVADSVYPQLAAGVGGPKMESSVLADPLTADDPSRITRR